MSRILVVEDSRDITNLYRRAFVDHDIHAVETAWAAIAALEHDTAFDLVILDMELPEVTGMVVLQHIRKMPEGQDIPVLVVSAADEFRKQAELVGIQVWLSKPVDFDALVDAAATYLDADVDD